MSTIPQIILLLLLKGIVCPGYGSATACADEKGNIIGEVACSAAPGKMVVSDKEALFECSREAAGEFIEACQNKYSDKVHQVGKRVTGSDIKFAPYTVVQGQSRTKLNSMSSLKAFKKPPSPPPRPVKKNENGCEHSAGFSFSLILILALISFS